MEIITVPPAAHHADRNHLHVALGLQRGQARRVVLSLAVLSALGVHRYSPAARVRLRDAGTLTLGGVPSRGPMPGEPLVGEVGEMITQPMPSAAGSCSGRTSTARVIGSGLEIFPGVWRQRPVWLYLLSPKRAPTCWMGGPTRPSTWVLQRDSADIDAAGRCDARDRRSPATGGELPGANDLSTPLFVAPDPASLEELRERIRQALRRGLPAARSRRHRLDPPCRRR